MELSIAHSLYQALRGDRSVFAYSGAFHDEHTGRLIALGVTLSKVAFCKSSKATITVSSRGAGGRCAGSSCTINGRWALGESCGTNSNFTWKVRSVTWLAGATEGTDAARDTRHCGKGVLTIDRKSVV